MSSGSLVRVRVAGFTYTFLLTQGSAVYAPGKRPRAIPAPRPACPAVTKIIMAIQRAGDDLVGDGLAGDGLAGDGLAGGDLVGGG